MTQNTPDLPCVLLIDLDNCPSQLSHLAMTITHFTKVVVCYGGFEPKIQLNQLSQLAPALVAGRLAVESMERKGKNAADFGLTFWAGRLLVEMPPETKFLVLSLDTDLDYLIDMLRQAGRQVERLDGNTYPHVTSTSTLQNTLVNASDNQSIPTSLETVVEAYRAVHIAARRTRPARRLTLLNSIRAHVKGSGVDPDAVLQELIRRGVLTVGKGGQVIYRDRVHVTKSVSATPELLALNTDITTEDTVSTNLTVVPAVASQLATVSILAITGPTDEYYAIHISNQRSRPTRRITLLNSIRSYFKGQPAVDPEAVMAELFRRGVVSQNRGGILRYQNIIPPLTVIETITGAEMQILPINPSETITGAEMQILPINPSETITGAEMKILPINPSIHASPQADDHLTINTEIMAVTQKHSELLAVVTGEKPEETVTQISNVLASTQDASISVDAVDVDKNNTKKSTRTRSITKSSQDAQSLVPKSATPKVTATKPKSKTQLTATAAPKPHAPRAPRKLRTPIVDTAITDKL